MQVYFAHLSLIISQLSMEAARPHRHCQFVKGDPHWISKDPYISNVLEDFFSSWKLVHQNSLLPKKKLAVVKADFPNSIKGTTIVVSAKMESHHNFTTLITINIACNGLNGITLQIQQLALGHHIMSREQSFLVAIHCCLSYPSKLRITGKKHK